ncbi:MAG: hypothetical protein HYV06_05295 [Deltaproteobacteria bacterium]|nr:hypothetical protein [Deltaproteobacteria bacterium]
MSLLHSRHGQTDRKVLLAVAGAIRSIETVTGSITEYQIGAFDVQNLHYIIQRLWSILESNGYTIDIDTNRMRRRPP